ncbi:MAG: hypothetical protein FWB93_06635 [Oscillospiraceae bacterium]|nr:hypothetical protein [Oscillospiraceae bacterium]
MKNKNQTLAWQQYNSGKDYKRRIGLYQNVRENERFYRGDQWRGVKSNGLPTPVFNVVSRIVNYLVNAVMAYHIRIRFYDDSLPFMHQSADTARVGEYMERLNRFVDYRFKRERIDSVIKDGVFDAALTGDGVFFTYWDSSIDAGFPYRGDFRTVTVDNVNLFVADVNSSDLQSQEYVILAGRASVSALRREATEYGVAADDVARIVADSDTLEQSGDFASIENADPNAGKATFLIKFSRNLDGRVVWEKSVKSCVIRREETGMKLYPIAYFNWERTRNSFHGNSPVTGLIGNQKYINKAYAMAMKHMTDTAFSKVIYDKKLIPEWSNEVGQAIGVVSGGNIDGVAKTLDVGEMQDGYLEVIEQVIRHTKEMSGATEIALGEVDPTNTSAILALREAAELPLGIIRDNINRCVEQLAAIWLEMMCEYYTDGRPVCYVQGDESFVATVDFARLRQDVLRASVDDSAAATRFSQVTLLNTLESLLRDGHITFEQYLQRLPAGVLPDRASLMGSVESEMQN